MQYTFHELLKQHKVIIPLIQRDYAQGRNNAKNIREAFLRKIKEAISTSTTLHLDFVYGYTEQIDNNIKAFIPIDGQQRLTSLWLIHWYVAPRKSGLIEDDIRKLLLSFTYHTRPSTQRFCQALVNERLFSKADNLSKIIKNEAWFRSGWIQDPTIQSMLNMIDTIQNTDFDNPETWRHLTEERKISFDYIDIRSDEFKLTDELYIKMNSRGKPLTDFESFKAQFAELISSSEEFKNHSLSYQGTSVTYSQYFSFKIDGEWTDLLWSYRKRMNNKLDDSFMAYIEFVAQFLFFKTYKQSDDPDPDIDFTFLSKIFRVKQNTDFLFNSLDFLSKINSAHPSSNVNCLDNFFDILFQDISLFDQQTNNLFLRAITNKGFDVKDKVLFYAILSLSYQMDITSPNDKLLDFTRILRNLLLAVRQPNQNKRIEYSSNLRLPNTGTYCMFIDKFIQLIVDQQDSTAYAILADNEFDGFSREIVHEKLKAKAIVSRPEIKGDLIKLEEHRFLQGDIQVFDLDKISQEHVDAFCEIWDQSIKNSLIIRAFLTCGDFSVQTHDYSPLAKKEGIWFFGLRDKWNRILTTVNRDERTKISNALYRFLEKFINQPGIDTQDKLQQIIDQYNQNDKDWRFYFIKYPTMTAANNKRLNLFTWKEKGFDIENLTSASNNPIIAYHINPYLMAVKHFLKEEPRVSPMLVQYSNRSYMEVGDHLYIECVDQGWLLSLRNGFVIPDEIIPQYQIQPHNQNFLLATDNEHDRIELVVQFIQTLLSL